jgi:large subunit ribosomal protein L4
MIKTDILTTKGTKKSSLTLPKEIFEVKASPALLAQSVRVYLSNQRKAKAKTKRRGEVSGSGIKIHRQKGTGRARHGDRYAPIFVGGGTTHGPTGLENYHLKMSQKMRRKALFAALALKLKEGKILFVEGLAKVDPKTQKVASILAKIAPKEKNILIILPKKLPNLFLAARNIPNLRLIEANLLNTYEVLKSQKIIFLPESLEVLKKTFLNQKKAKK